VKRVLIANRGEIAVRIIRACHELDLEAVAVYSDADVRSPHVLLADHAVRIGPPPAPLSYLSFAAVLDAATHAGADAIHPGYGFLSENAAFAAACHERGLTFVGPPADAIARMGAKTAARALAQEIGVPVVPGDTPADQSDTTIASVAERVGFPVLIKPAAGGGGIGMRAVGDASALPAALAAARREAGAAFGDATLYVERLIDRPRHVEMQIIADDHGNVVHLFERECSLQRRHQKVVEESPSLALTPALRERMGAAAVAIAAAAGYRNAGTVEFLIDRGGADARFYFLEMNTRLQVEHPVTEQVVGVDLVCAQLAVAGGDRLPWRQNELRQRGHALEARIYAEDPTDRFLPQAGRILLYRPPFMPGIRIDSGIAEDMEVSVHYDPLLAKLIAWGETRDAARRRAVAALTEFPILGIRTNIAFLIALLEHQDVVAGNVDVQFLDRCVSTLLSADQDVPEVVKEIARAANSGSGPDEVMGEASDPWTHLRGFRG
jgi:acetyl-CoA carboxylase biotin carboxylase subunit